MTDVLVCVKRVPDPTGEVVLTPDGAKIITLYPADELPIANPY